MLEARDLVCGYGGAPVIHGLDFRVDKGGSVAVLGANGAGKSTLMKALSRSLPIQSGGIVWKGTDISSWTPARAARAGVGYVPQENNVFGDLTVYENLEISGDTNPRGRELVEEYTRRFAVLGERAKQRAGTLSGGERQMLALASALVMEPSVLLLDEPTSGLAPLIMEEVSRIIQGVIEEGISVVWVVEQDPGFVLEIVDRAYLMSGGEFIGEHSRAELADPRVLERLLEPEREEEREAKVSERSVRQSPASAG